jgi:Tfp pilus assembly protein PilF
MYHRDMRAWLAPLVLLSTTATSALADAPPSLTPDAKAHYKTALAKARKLQAAKKYADATAAFNDALAAAPGDATVLGELGWTAYLAKDYKTAEEITRKAVAAQAVPNVRGATLYNLGLIQEQNGDKAGAIASYAASLKARPNAVVAARLKTLDANAAAAADPYAPHALTGYASIAELCTP